MSPLTKGTYYKKKRRMTTVNVDLKFFVLTLRDFVDEENSLLRIWVQI